jgi:hypothetical protein
LDYANRIEFAAARVVCFNGATLGFTRLYFGDPPKQKTLLALDQHKLADFSASITATGVMRATGMTGCA